MCKSEMILMQLGWGLKAHGGDWNKVSGMATG